MADSESSTVRGVALPAGSVKAVVGGAIDPLVRRFFSATIDSISNGYATSNFTYIVYVQNLGHL